ncbi:MAG: NAD(+) synthase [Patescibacteria group bacterium]
MIRKQQNSLFADSAPVPAPAPTPEDEIYNVLVLGLKKYFTKNNFKRAVLGVSGGVDSALVLKIAVDALGSQNVTALIMPELGLSNPENMEHAKVLCEYFGVTVFYQPINGFLMDFSTPPWKPSALAHINTKARIRAVLLYNYANTEHALVLGTSNKSELLLGYGTKYGDLAADIEVIGELFKTDVIKLADYIGLPPEIAHKPPTAELSPGQTDEAEIGATYYDLDKVLMKLDEGVTGCLDQGLPMSLVQLVFRRVEENKHKLQMPPSIKIP